MRFLSRQLLGRVLIAFIIAVCAVLFLEWSVRIYDRGRSQQILPQAEGIQAISDPYVVYRTQENFSSIQLNTGFHGLRGEPIISSRLGSGTFRIIILGGSAVFGFDASSDQATISARLQHILREEYPDRPIEVVNAGQVGYGSAQELMLYQTVLGVLQPDLVIQLDGYNDFYRGLVEGEAPLTPPMWSDIGAERMLRGYLTAWLTWEDVRLFMAKISTQSALAQYMMRGYVRLVRISQSEHAPTSPAAVVDNPEVIPAYVRISQYLAAAAAADGADYIGAFQPLLLDRGERTVSEQEYADTAESRLAVVRVVRQYMDAADRLFAALPVDDRPHRVDIRKAVASSTEALFLDDVHFTDLGNERVAEQLADVVRPFIQ